MLDLHIGEKGFEFEKGKSKLANSRPVHYLRAKGFENIFNIKS